MKMKLILKSSAIQLAICHTKDTIVQRRRPNRNLDDNVFGDGM